MNLNLKIKINATNIILAICVLAFLTLLGFFVFEVFFGSDFLMHDKGIEKFYAGSMIILTIFILVVAWYKFSKLNKTSDSDFLLRIDSKYCSKEIMKAREIIHGLFLKNSKIEVMADKILAIADSKKKTKEFIYIINFVDFLETIAYLCNTDRVSSKAVEELTGESISFYYRVLKNWIDRRRQREGMGYYCELEKLVQKIDKNED